MRPYRGLARLLCEAPVHVFASLVEQSIHIHTDRPAGENAMKQRSFARLLAVAVLPWLIALAVPDVRDQLRLQSDGWMNVTSYFGDLNVHEDSPWYRLRPRPI